MKDRAERFCGGRTCTNICRGLAKFLFASSQKCDSPFWGSCEVWIFHEVEWGERNGRTLFAPTMRCVVVMVWGINNNAKR